MLALSGKVLSLDQARSLIDEFLQHLLYERRLADNTAMAYASDLNQLLTFWEKLEHGHHKIFLQEAVKQFLLSLFYNKELKALSIARKISSLRCFKKYLAGKGYSVEITAKNPRTKRKLPAIAEIKDLIYLLDDLPAAALNAKFPLRDKAILELLYATGVRCNELVNIKLSHVYFAQRAIKICMGKGGKERMVLYGNAAAAKLKDYLENERTALTSNITSSYLFAGTHGERMTTRTVQRVLENFRRFLPANKNLSPHTLRHSFATHMLAAGANLRTVQELLGHSNLLTTELYTQVSQTEMAKFLEEQHPLQAFAKKRKSNME